jgi:hypothetical protein
MVGDVCGLSLVWCHLCNFKNGRFGQGFCYLSVSHFFVPNFRVSAWPLKCTKHLGANSDFVP